MNEAQDVQEAEVGNGRYIYCIANRGAEVSFSKIGIEDADVYMIPYKDIVAVAHACQAKPYETKDEERAKRWIFTHNYVIDKMTERFGTVLPFSFDVIVRGNDNTIKDWLSENYEKLKQDLERVKAKAEYSVQIFCDQDKLTEKIMNNAQELRKLKEGIEKGSKGHAYLLQRKFELKIKSAISAEISKLAEELSSKLKEHVEEIRVEEKTKWVSEKYKEKKLIVALSCLAHKDKVEKLAEVLSDINKREGFAVRFTGPWAPFSFVRLKEARR